MSRAEAAPLPVPPDTVIADKYVVGRVIASGGMGVVAEGHHTALGQRVAIKFLLPEVRDREEAVQRFLREARAAARVESDHVVRVFDVGTHDGVPYMVMEYLEGEDLDSFVHRSGRLGVSVAVEIVVEALEGLSRAHSLGIVHRDLKPSNLFLAVRSGRSRARRVKILDFGISKVLVEGPRPNPTLTSTKSMMGSPGYMSPEQVRSTKGVDARTDVWSIGVILYELLTGEPAFVGETLGDVFAKIREEPLPSLRTRRPDVPEALDAVVMRCLERDRTRRFDDASALLDALLPFSKGVGGETTGTIVDEPSNEGRRSQVDAATMLAEPPRRPHDNTVATWTSGAEKSATRRWAIAGVAVATIAGLGVAWVARGGSATDAASSASATPARDTQQPAALGASAPPPPTVQPNGEPPPTPTVDASATPSAVPVVSAKPPVAVGPRGPQPPRSPPSTDHTAGPQPTAAPTATPKKKDDLGI